MKFFYYILLFFICIHLLGACSSGSDGDTASSPKESEILMETSTGFDRSFYFSKIIFGSDNNISTFGRIEYDSLGTYNETGTCSDLGRVQEYPCNSSGTYNENPDGTFELIPTDQPLLRGAFNSNKDIPCLTGANAYPSLLQHTLWMMTAA